MVRGWGGELVRKKRKKKGPEMAGKRG